VDLGLRPLASSAVDLVIKARNGGSMKLDQGPRTSAALLAKWRYKGRLSENVALGGASAALVIFPPWEALQHLRDQLQDMGFAVSG